MGLDIKLPIGLMFSILGILLGSYGLATMSNHQMYASSLGININIWWGLLMLVFGVIMLWSAKKPGKKKVDNNEQSNTD